MNRLVSVRESQLRGVPFLKKLILSHNIISFFAFNIFNNLKHLECLHLDNNRLAYLTGADECQSRSLRYLRLQNNYLVNSNSAYFTHCQSLTVLHVGDNNISKLPTNSFSKNFSSITHLSLKNNSISCLSSGFFSKFPNLIDIDLSYNLIKRLDDSSLFRENLEF